MAKIDRLQQKDKEVTKGIAYAKASLGMEGLHMSEHTEKLICNMGMGRLWKKNCFRY